MGLHGVKSGSVEEIYLIGEENIRNIQMKYSFL